MPDAVEPEDLMRLIARVALYKAALERIAMNDDDDTPEDLVMASNGCCECWSVEIATEALRNG